MLLPGHDIEIIKVLSYRITKLLGVRNGITGKPTSYLNIGGPKVRYEERVDASKKKKLVAPLITESWVNKLEHNNVGSKGEISGGSISRQGGAGGGLFTSCTN